MGTKVKPSRVAAALFGKARRAVLGLLLTHSDRRFYVREIVRAAGSGQGAVQRELANLADAGLLVRSREGRQVYYQANRRSQVFAELRSIMVKTSGVADVLRDALSPLRRRITVGFIYGSVACGTEKPESDIDVMIVGDVAFAEVVGALGKTHDVLGRELNPSVYPPEEFRRKALDRHHFVKALLEGPKVFIVGDENELAGLVA